jgi:hypothetical protein
VNLKILCWIIIWKVLFKLVWSRGKTWKSEPLNSNEVQVVDDVECKLDDILKNEVKNRLINFSFQNQTV